MKVLTLFLFFFAASLQAYPQELRDGSLLDSRADCVPAGGMDGYFKKKPECQKLT